MQTPRSVPVGSGPPLLRLDRLEERRRPRGERPVGEELQPAEPGAARRSGPSGSPLRSPRLDRRLELLLRMQAWTRIGSVAALVERADTRRSPRPRPSWSESAPGSWTATTPRRTRSRREPAIAARSARQRGGGDVIDRRAGPRTRGGRPLGSPAVVAADEAAVRIGGRVGRSPAIASAGAADPERSGGRGPTARRRRPGATRSRSSAVGQRPSRSVSQPWPSSQASASAGRAWAARDHRQCRRRASAPRTGRPVERRCRPRRDGDGRRSGRGSRPRPGPARTDGVRVGPRLELDRGAGERDPAVR